MSCVGFWFLSSNFETLGKTVDTCIFGFFTHSKQKPAHCQRSIEQWMFNVKPCSPLKYWSPSDIPVIEMSIVADIQTISRDCICKYSCRSHLLSAHASLRGKASKIPSTPSSPNHIINLINQQTLMFSNWRQYSICSLPLWIIKGFSEMQQNNILESFHLFLRRFWSPRLTVNQICLFFWGNRTSSSSKTCRH